jgi:hypothetical protein
MKVLSRSTLRRAYNRSLKGEWQYIIPAAVLTWGSFIFGPLALLVLLGCFVLFAVRMRLLALAIFLLLTPISLTIILAFTSYFGGHPHMAYMGLPSTEFFNIDPELRCERTTGGCLVNGTEFLSQWPNNFIVRTLIHTLGPARGSYIGPYPTEADAKSALRSASPISVHDARSDEFDVGAAHVKLDRDVGRGLLEGPGMTYDDGYYKSNAITGVIWKATVLILRIPCDRADNKTHARIAVIDLKTGRPFAYYAEGDYYHRFPPVTWRRSGL